MNKVLEMSKRMSKGGRKRIRMVLLTIHKDGEMNKNGITWEEQNVLNNLESIKNIPICATFIDEDKTILFDHGYTETVELDGGKSEPLFNNSEVVGTIEKAKIEDLEIDGEVRRVLVGYGYLYCQRYFALCEKLMEDIAVSSVKSSIEVMGKEENNSKIVYDGGYKEKGRKPSSFDFSATCLLGVEEADDSCYVLEVAENQNKEEQKTMGEKEMRELITSVITETNSKNDELNTKIKELNSTIESKDAEIKELNDKVNANVDADKEKDEKIEELTKKNEELEKELNECKKAEKKAALDKAIGEFSEDEQKYAESEINSFRENPLEGDVDAVVNAIHAGIGRASKKAEADAKVAEQNAKKEDADLDIFSEVNSAEDESNEDVNIF